MVSAFPGVEWNDDAEAAVWVRLALRPWRPLPLKVASLVPATFAAHGRILHPLWNGDRRARWSDFAAATGRTLDAQTRFNELAGLPHDFVRHSSLPPPWHQPEDGSLPRTTCAAVATTLEPFTSTADDCLFGLWVGYGWPEIEALGRERAPQLALENHDCYLFRGPVSSALAFESHNAWFQSPTVWWPADRAWFVATDVDGYCSYVAASTAALHALAARDDVELLECRAEDPIDPSPYPPQDVDEQ